ncbi:hypothetical protein [Leifsonia sp. Leaf264]|uniref:hypothetical protein n=1 Tax=Leifsonia sp. Leaf264 TaxID=1736314 RepID=UPI000701810F|nr:hypothetical protein [Leifsonia sp. Leaf264]KQO98561.1 hypothetical protein ASF30_10895 [Leifsonia sp. Leaf264]
MTTTAFTASEHPRGRDLGIIVGNGTSGSFAEKEQPAGAPVSTLGFDPHDPNIVGYRFRSGDIYDLEYLLARGNAVAGTDHTDLTALIADLQVKHPDKPWFVPEPIAAIDDEITNQLEYAEQAVGFAFRADMHPSYDLGDTLAAAFPEDVAAITADGLYRTDAHVLTLLADRLGYDIADETSYDSDEFPKMVFDRNPDGSGLDIASHPYLNLPYYEGADGEPITGDAAWDVWWADVSRNHDHKPWFDGLRARFSSAYGGGWGDDHFAELLEDYGTESTFRRRGVPLPTRHNVWQLEDGRTVDGAEAFDEWCDKVNLDDDLFNTIARSTDHNGAHNLRLVEKEARRLGIDLDKIGAGLPAFKA